MPDFGGFYHDSTRDKAGPDISLRDLHNDGDLDLLQSYHVDGRFWRNLGGFQFQEATDAAGLAAINFTYRQWYEFFDCPVSPFHEAWQPPVDALRSQPGLAPTHPLDNRPYYSDALFGDFDNDGWVDLVVLDRRETQRIEARAILFMNRGDGTFEAKPTTFSGLDGTGISGEAADLNNDGLLDLIFAADPDNSGFARDMGRYEDKVYWNTGPYGARENHWLRLRFSGVTEAELIGARVTVHDTDSGRLAGMRVVAADHCYKSGSPLEAHFGLAQHEHVDLEVIPLDGERAAFGEVQADGFYTLDLATGTSTVVAQ